GVPELDGLVTRRRHGASIPGKCAGHDCTLVASKNRHGLPRCRVPDAGSAVPPSANDQSAIRGEDNHSDNTAMAPQASNPLSSSQIPEFNDAFFRRSGEDLAV